MVLDCYEVKEESAAAVKEEGSAADAKEESAADAKEESAAAAAAETEAEESAAAAAEEEESAAAAEPAAEPDPRHYAAELHPGDGDEFRDERYNVTVTIPRSTATICPYPPPRSRAPKPRGPLEERFPPAGAVGYPCPVAWVSDRPYGRGRIQGRTPAPVDMGIFWRCTRQLREDARQVRVFLDIKLRRPR